MGSATRTQTRYPEAADLARKPNYDFDKRRKELDRKATRDKKLEERRLRRLQGGGDEVIDPLDAPAEGEPVDADSTGTPSDQP